MSNPTPTPTTQTSEEMKTQLEALLRNAAQGTTAPASAQVPASSETKIVKH